MSKKNRGKSTQGSESSRPALIQSSSHFLERHIWWILLGLIFLGGLCSYLIFDPFLSTNGDNALYIVLGMSWAQGKGNSTICTPGEPPNTMVPPGYPLLLASLLVLFGDHFLPLKLFSTLLFLLSLPLLFQIIRDRTGNVFLAMSVAILAAINLNLLDYGHMVMTETPFLFFSLVGIFFLQRSLKSSSRAMTTREKIHFGLAIFFLVFAYHIRSIGVVLPAAMIVVLILKKRYRLALVAGVAILCLVLPWAIRNQTAVEGTGYMDFFVLKNAYDPAQGKLTAGNLLNRVVGNLRTYGVFVIPQALIPILSPLLNHQKFTETFGILQTWVTLITLFGFIIWARRSIGFLEIYTVFFLGVCIIWPEIWSGMRFLIPVIPLLIFYFVLGLFNLLKIVRKLGSYLSPTLGKIVYIMAIIWIISRILWVNFGALARGTERGHQYPPQWRNYFDAAQWSREHTTKESIFVARKPSLFYLQARRQVLNYPYTADTEQMMTFFRDHDVDYVLVDGFSWTGTTARYLLPAVQANAENFRIVHQLENPNTWVLQFVGRELEPGENDRFSR